MITAILAAVLAAQTVTTTQNVLTWNASSTATGYNVMRGVNGCSNLTTASFTQIASVSALTFTDTNLNAGTVYSYYVTASNSGGTSGPSNCVTMTTTPPPPPLGLTLKSK